MESKLEVHRSKTLAEATEIAWKVVDVVEHVCGFLETVVFVFRLF